MSVNQVVGNGFLRQHLTQLLPLIKKQLPKETLQNILQQYVRGHKLGQRERYSLQDAAYHYVRYRPAFVSEMISEQVAIAVLDSMIDSTEQKLLTPEQLLNHGYYLPQWLLEALQSIRGGACTNLCVALQQTAPVDVRVNLLASKRKKVLAALEKAGIEAVETAYSPWGIRLTGKPKLKNTPLYTDGTIELQDEGSQLLALLTGVRRDEIAVDFCAGAGGKTLAMLAMMRAGKSTRSQSGKVYAFDVSAKRLERLKPRIQRSGIASDALYIQAIENEHDARLQKLYGKAQRVLVDAPCSGTGTLRRQPEIKWKVTHKEVLQYQAQQLSILKAASGLVAKGGRLVYATCSLLSEENEAVAIAFNAWCKEQNLPFVQLPVEQILVQAKVRSSESLCSSNGMYLRLWPDVHQTDGFFAACWIIN